MGEVFCNCPWVARFDRETQSYEQQTHNAKCAFGQRAKIAQNHIDRAIETFNRLYPGHAVSIGYIPDEQCKGGECEPAQAFTRFPEDGGSPEIWISDATPIYGVPDTLLHEFAHIIAGLEAGHGPSFEEAYQRLWQGFEA